MSTPYSPVVTKGEHRADPHPERAVRHGREPRVFHPASAGFPHAYVRRGEGRFEMLLSTSPDLYGEDHYPEQGLWPSSSDTPGGDVDDRSTPRSLLRAGEGPACHGTGSSVRVRAPFHFTIGHLRVE